VHLNEIKSVAARSQYLIRATLDYLYPPYNNWSVSAGQSAVDLLQLISYLETWPRNRLLIEQPAGYFIPCDLCDLKTIAYLMYQEFGWCKPPAFTDPPVTCTVPNFPLSLDVIKVATPTNGPNLKSFVLTTESGSPIVADNFELVPCYRDWVALGLGPPPAGTLPPGCGLPFNNPWGQTNRPRGHPGFCAPIPLGCPTV
jgi:hypothetical protein